MSKADLLSLSLSLSLANSSFHRTLEFFTRHRLSNNCMLNRRFRKKLDFFIYSVPIFVCYSSIPALAWTSRDVSMVCWEKDDAHDARTNRARRRRAELCLAAASRRNPMVLIDTWHPTIRAGDTARVLCSCVLMDRYGRGSCHFHPSYIDECSRYRCLARRSVEVD